MMDLMRYSLGDDNTLRRFGSREICNRVLYGGHNHENGDWGRFFTFAGDAPFFMGAASDCLKNNWCYQAKRGVLQSGVALTPGVTLLSNDLNSSDSFSRWFHNAGDIISTWHHGWMEYDLTQNSPHFPEVVTNIKIYPLQRHDGFLVHYDVLADSTVVFCAVLGGMTDYIGRFDAQDNPQRNLSDGDFAGNQARILSECSGCINDSGNKNTLLAGCNFSARVIADAAGAALELCPAMSLVEHDGEKSVLKFVKRLAPGERLSGDLVVLLNGTEAELNEYLANDPVPEILTAIADKYAGIKMTTPDERLNSTVMDQLIALDAAYHEPTFFHGAIGYHAPFLGWRGWYAASLAGWNDRVRGASRAHLRTMQKKHELPEKVWYDGADRPDLDHEGTQYSHLENSIGRMNAMLFKDDIYNMQEVAVDMILHYLECSGDLELGTEIFDDLAMHLAWEERIFDRGDGLYQNFLNTWISDGHSYNGGGCAQSSFYNYAANRAMVKLGRKLGRDVTVFEARAEKIFQAVNDKLWLENAGVFAEYIDTLGNKLVHPSPELSTIYLAGESALASNVQLGKALQFSEKYIRSVITVNRKGRLAYSANWLPKKYSTCGIFPAENAALALAYFKNFRKNEALRIMDGLLDAFALSISPGAIAHVLTAHGGNDLGDWDFTDVSSTYLRMLVEGLWGVNFRKLENRIFIAPQLPDKWENADLTLPDLSIKFQRQAEQESLYIKTDCPEEKVIIIPGHVSIKQLSDKNVTVKDCDDMPGSMIVWYGRGELTVNYSVEKEIAAVAELCTRMPERAPAEAVPAGFEHLDISNLFNVKLTEIFQQRYLSPRPEKYSIGVRVNGRYAWEWNHYGHNAVVVQDAALRNAENGIYHLDSGWSFPTPAAGCNALCVSVWDNYPTSAEIALQGQGKELVLFVFGSTNAMQSFVPNARITVSYADNSSSALDLVPPVNFDDMLVPACQQQFENFYWSDGCHGSAVRIKLTAGRELSAVKIEALANEVIIGILGAVLVR